MPGLKTNCASSLRNGSRPGAFSATALIEHDDVEEHERAVVTTAGEGRRRALDVKGAWPAWEGPHCHAPHVGPPVDPRRSQGTSNASSTLL